MLPTARDNREDLDDEDHDDDGLDDEDFDDSEDENAGKKEDGFRPNEDQIADEVFDVLYVDLGGER